MTTLQLDMQHYCAGHYSKSVNLCLVAVVVVVPTVLACTCTLYSDQYRVLLSPTAVWYGSNIPFVMIFVLASRFHVYLPRL